jgi:hypothetical protein
MDVYLFLSIFLKNAQNFLDTLILEQRAFFIQKNYKVFIATKTFSLTLSF